MHYCLLLWQQIRKSTANNQKVSTGEYNTRTLSNKNSYIEAGTVFPIAFPHPTYYENGASPWNSETWGVPTMLALTCSACTGPFKYLPRWQQRIGLAYASKKHYRE